MLMSKHCSSIYFICKTTVLVFGLSVTVVMFLLTDLTSAPDDKSVDMEHCQKIPEKVSILHMISIADATGSNTNAAILTALGCLRVCGIIIIIIM